MRSWAVWDKAGALRVAVTRTVEHDYVLPLPGFMAQWTCRLLESQATHHSLRGREGAALVSQALVTTSFQGLGFQATETD